MLSLQIEHLMQEVRDSRVKLRSFLEKRQEMVRNLVGNHYRTDSQQDPTPENYAYGYREYVRPQLCFGVPRCRVKPVHHIQHAQTARALEEAIGLWSTDTAWKESLLDLLDDAFVGFGISKVGVDERGHYGEGGGLAAVQGDFQQRPLYPFAVRVDPVNFIIDARARRVREARLIGDRHERDLDDLVNDERYDPAARQQLREFAKELHQPEGEADQPFPQRNNQAVRRRIPILELYLPEHGLLITIAETGAEHGVILDQAPYVGPDEGPYTIWGLSRVPGEIFPLSTLQAIWDEFLELNQHARVAARNAASHKKIGVFAPSAQDDAKRIQQAKSGELVPVKDPQAIGDYELGGASETQLQWIEFLRRRLDRNMGYSDTQRGTAGGRTATAEALAQQGSDLRIDAMRDLVADAVKEVYRKVSWHFHNNPLIGRIPMVIEDPTTGQPMQATFVAGPWEGGWINNQYIPPEVASDITDYLLEIDGSSMTKTDDAIEQKRAQDELQLTFQLASLGLPINWRGAITRYGEKMGTKNLADIILADPAGMMIPHMPTGQMPMPQDPRGMNGGMNGGMGGGGSMPGMAGGGAAGPRAGGTGLPGLLAQARGGAFGGV